MNLFLLPDPLDPSLPYFAWISADLFESGRTELSWNGPSPPRRQACSSWPSACTPTGLDTWSQSPGADLSVSTRLAGQCNGQDP